MGRMKRMYAFSPRKRPDMNPIRTVLLLSLLAGPLCAEEARILEWKDDVPVVYPRLFIEPGKLAEVRAKIAAKKAWKDFATNPPKGHPNAAALKFLVTGSD